MYKEFKKRLKSIRIDDNDGSGVTQPHVFKNNLNKFLRENEGIKIIQVIKHYPYSVTLIYEELEEVKQR